MITPRGAWVYYCYADGTRPIYIGMTRNYVLRFRDHRAKRAWWPQVERIEIEPYRNLECAAAAEYAAITSERPPYNLPQQPKTFGSWVDPTPIGPRTTIVGRPPRTPSRKPAKAGLVFP